jgi:hypothetical protein
MTICIFSSICLVNKNLVNKDFLFILPLLDLSITSNLSDIVINFLTIQSFKGREEAYKLKKTTHHQSLIV